MALMLKEAMLYIERAKACACNVRGAGFSSKFSSTADPARKVSLYTPCASCLAAAVGIESRCYCCCRHSVAPRAKYETRRAHLTSVRKCPL